jgi:hypothetical protein
MIGLGSASASWSGAAALNEINCFPTELERKAESFISE